MTRIFVAIVLGLFPLSDVAAAQENTTLFALGGLSCLDWNRPTNFANAGLKDWISQFAAHSGADKSFRTDPMQGSSPQKTFEWTDAYCKAHPLNGLGVAATTMINELSIRQFGSP